MQLQQGQYVNDLLRAASLHSGKIHTALYIQPSVTPAILNPEKYR